MEKARYLVVSCAIVCLFISLLCGNFAQAKDGELKQTNVQALRAMARRLKVEQKQKRLEAVEVAKRKGWVIREETPGGRIIEIMELDEYGIPVYYTTRNLNAADTVSTDEVWPGGSTGLNLTGNGILLGIWDGGGVLTSHQEFGGRVVQRDAPGGTSGHATHVAGTMVAGGVVPSAKGMSYEALLDAYDFHEDLGEMAGAAADGLRASNHSYGEDPGWVWSDESGWIWTGNPDIDNDEDYRFGLYTSVSQSLDEIAHNAPYYLIVKAAGNSRGDGPDGGEHLKDGEADGGYDCIPPDCVAKNILVVGSVSDIIGGYTAPGDVSVEGYSVWGPADDGRIKPDIVANGNGLYSASDAGDDWYVNSSGTSMAAPNVTGSLGLLMQQYRSLHPGSDMLASTLRGLVIHTADEAGPSLGPDYMHGWGLLNTKRAAEVITNDGLPDDNPGKLNSIKEMSLADGEVHEFQVLATGSPLSATLAWTDPPGTPTAASLDPPATMLVNDLDVSIYGPLPSMGMMQPWTLDPASPSSSAVHGDNDLDNVEHVYWQYPSPGTYLVSVTHKGALQGGSQDYSLIISGARPSEGPVVADDQYTVDEDNTLAIAAAGVLSNDFDPAGNPLTAIMVDGASNGAVTLNADGSFNYVPDLNFNGTDTFTYKANNGSEDSNVAIVTINVTPVNDPPVAVDDEYTTDEDTTLEVPSPGALANDTDVDGDELSLVSGSIDKTGTVGSVSWYLDNRLSYNPMGKFEHLAVGQTAEDSFTYDVSDPPGATDTGKVTITITGVNDPPVAVDDSYTTDEDTVLNVDAPGVLENDTDVDTSDTIEVQSVDTSMTTGSVEAWSSNGSFTYDPGANFQYLAVGETAEDTFTYVVSDSHGATGTATVTITVTGVNDPPVAVDDFYSTDEETALSIDTPGVLGNDTDVDASDILKIQSIDQSMTAGMLTGWSSSGSFSYDPGDSFQYLAVGETAEDTFTYVVFDSQGATDTATVTITVTGVNDPPVAVDDFYSTDEDTALSIDAPGVLGNDTDVDASDILKIQSIDQSMTAGMVTDWSPFGSFTYDPGDSFQCLAVGETAEDTFTYVVFDPQGATDTATVTITIIGVNDPPVAVDDSYTTDERTDLNVEAPGVLENDTDVDASDVLHVEGSDDSSIFGGTVDMEEDGSFVYTPDSRFCGYDSFTYVVSDPHDATDTGTVNITVNCRNQRSIGITSLDFVFDAITDPEKPALSGSFSMTNTSDGPYDVQAVSIEIIAEYGVVKKKQIKWEEVATIDCAFTPAPYFVFSDEITVDFACMLAAGVPDDAVAIRVIAEVEIFGAKKEYIFRASQDLPSDDAPLAAPAMISSVPDETGLKPNYPNPFNPETWIPFQLAEDASVKIEIYDVTGRLVRSLNLGDLTAGYYLDRSRAAYWDGRNESGESVASGVYICKLIAGDISAISRMVIFK